MKQIFQYRKLIGLTVSISIFLLNFPFSPAQAAMIPTEHAIHQESEQLTDRAQVRAFLGRADVLAQMQAYGVSHEEALSRVNSLTDKEIASIAGKMDQFPAVAGPNGGGGDGNYEFGSLLGIIGIAIFAIFVALAIYFSRTMEKEEKPQQKKNGSATNNQIGEDLPSDSPDPSDPLQN